MGTYNGSLNHFVFSTYLRKPTITSQDKEQLVKYLWTVCQDEKCLPFAIDGTHDHIHILLSLHPAIAASDLIKLLKTSSTLMIKSKKLFPEFVGWQDGFGHFTYAMDAKPALVRYIQNQEQHHAKYSSRDEMKMLLKKHAVVYEDKFLI